MKTKKRNPAKELEDSLVIIKTLPTKKKKKIEDVEPKKKKKKKASDTVIDVTGGEKKKKKKVDGSVMPVEKDSYIIVRYQGKNRLALAHNPERNRAYIDASLATDEPISITYDSDTLLAALGRNPKPGSAAFGVKINPFVSSEQTEHGEFNYFRELNDLEKKAFASALKRTKATMNELGVGSVLPVQRFDIMPAKGKYAGMYMFRRKGDDVNDSITLMPMSFEDRKYNQYVLLHEYGHAVWCRLMSKALQARWIALFHGRLELTNIAKDRLESMLDELLAFQGNLKEFYKELPDDDRPIFNEVLGHYKRYHKMDSRSLDVLHIENTEKFASMWPKRTTIVENIKEDPSAYAMTKPEEFWAEAFAFTATGRNMSKDITKLMERTLKMLKSV